MGAGVVLLGIEHWVVLTRFISIACRLTTVLLLHFDEHRTLSKGKVRKHEISY